MGDIHPRRKLFWLGVVLYLITINLWIQLRGDFKITLSNPEHSESTGKEVGCDLPLFENMGTKEYAVPADLLKCKGESNWVCVEPGRARVCPEADQKHQGILCTYTFIIRIDDDTNKNGSSINAGTEYVGLQSDYFYVNCTANDGQKWNSIMAGIQIQPLPASETSTTGLGLNILIWGFDSLSRLQFITGLPKTYKYLSTNQNAVILTGVNKVGEGKEMAFIPMLTGKMENELPVTQRKIGKKANFVNVYPFIWNDFKKSGYVTAFGVDGLNFDTYHFNELPTDHYLRPFYNSAGHYFSKEKPFCIQGMSQHKIMMKWIEDFYNAYPKELKFSIIFHSKYLQGNYNLTSNVDDDLINFLVRFHNSEHQNNTLLIIMSNPEYRFSKAKETLQSRQEDRMPLLSMIFPSWFEDKYPQAVINLRTNANRLTSPLDIHSTLQSMLYFENPQTIKGKEKGISLFNEIPISRTCSDAGIAPYWCMCSNWKEMASNSEEVIGTSRIQLNEFNRIADPLRHETKLILGKQLS